MNVDVAVIMCTWKRPERLNKTLDLLCEQKYKNFSFYIWNNNIKIRDIINLTYNIYKDKLSIKITHSEKNIGGFGRFKLAQQLTNIHDKIIFIDDDQIFSNNMIDKFLENYDEDAIKSRWSWRFFSNNYTYREHITEGGINVHYCGTGGMILSSRVFKCEELYKIPNDFLFVEDLWLCFIANHYLKMNLISIKNDFISQEEDGKDQTTSNFYIIKNNFLEYLINKRGWKILQT